MLRRHHHDDGLFHKGGTVVGPLDIPVRPVKPRKEGLTLINDRGVGLGAWHDTIQMAGQYVDVVKLGIGTAYVMQNLEEKVAFLEDHEILVVLGGTLFENFWAQGKLDEYEMLLHRLKLRCVEVSSGSYPIPVEEKIAIVQHFAHHYQVMAEVGSKDESSQPAIKEQVAEAHALRTAGASKVIMEGRASGTGGMYNAHGEADDALINAMTRSIPISDIIFEAPQEQQQIAFIRRYGPNVNLGNVPFEDILMLETERLGLRFDTQNCREVL